jgi:hypothetical protein
MVAIILFPEFCLLFCWIQIVLIYQQERYVSRWRAGGWDPFGD